MIKYYESEGKGSSGGASSSDIKMGYTSETVDDKMQDMANYMSEYKAKRDFGGFVGRAEGTER